jgi:hypothetical protein
LRRTKDGNLILHAIKVETGEGRSYRVDRIESVKVTTRVFKPKYEIEFSPSGIIHAPPTPRKSEFTSFGGYGLIGRPRRSTTRTRTTNPFGMKYVFQCGMCMKKFTKTKYDANLREHRNSWGMSCSGRTGYFVGNK